MSNWRIAAAYPSPPY